MRCGGDEKRLTRGEASPLAGPSVPGARGRRGLREVRAEGDGNSSRKADGVAMLPVVLRPSTGEGLSAGLITPHASKVPSGAEVGKDVEEVQELLLIPARGRQVYPCTLSRANGRKAWVVTCLLAYPSR